MWRALRCSARLRQPGVSTKSSLMLGNDGVIDATLDLRAAGGLTCKDFPNPAMLGRLCQAEYKFTPTET